MYPRLFEIPGFELFGLAIGPITVPTYGVLVAIAFLAALWLVGREARRQGSDPAALMDLAFFVLFGGIVGAKLLLVVVEWRYYAANPGDILSVLRSGGVFYGGLLGGLAVAFWYTRRHQIDPWRAADVLAPATVLAQAIGRFGCLAAGCCWGEPTQVPWAVTYRDIYAFRTIGTPMDIPLHPSQVYESLAAGLIFLVLLFVAGRKRFHGQVVWTYVVLYSAARFVLEYFRGDDARGSVLGGVLSTSQLIALVLVLGALAVLPYLLKRNRVAEAAE